jgi:hypothetical protein
MCMERINKESRRTRGGRREKDAKEGTLGDHSRTNKGVEADIAECPILGGKGEVEDLGDGPELSTVPNLDASRVADDEYATARVRDEYKD